MRVRFEKVQIVGLPGLLANGALVFDADGPLGGLTLKGFAVWRSKKKSGELTVTFPSRPQRNGKEYWLLRAADDEDEAPVWRLREMILREYAEWQSKKL